MKTKTNIIYKAMPYGLIATIPAGTPCIPASNLPKGGYWIAGPWPGISERAESWLRNYGFHIEEGEAV